MQSFRSRNDIYRRERGPREPESVFEGVLDHGERDGWGLWLDPAIAEDPIWKEHWAGVEAVTVKVAEDSIVLEADTEGTAAASTVGIRPVVQAPSTARRKTPTGRRESAGASNGSTRRRATGSSSGRRAKTSSSTTRRSR